MKEITFSRTNSFEYGKEYEDDIDVTMLGTSQSGDPFVLVLFKCFHNTFTRCPRFSALFV